MTPTTKSEKKKIVARMRGRAEMTRREEGRVPHIVVVVATRIVVFVFVVLVGTRPFGS